MRKIFVYVQSKNKKLAFIVQNANSKTVEIVVKRYKNSYTKEIVDCLKKFVKE